jgi:inorganic pyrophosphatase
MDEAFWRALESLLADTAIVIDRPKGSRHPDWPKIIYPLDYGYLEDTRAMDGAGIDVWRGSKAEADIVGILCTVDLAKRDSEIKILIGCTEEEIRTVHAFHNADDTMKGILVRHGR